jgi:hypothetical protein
MRPTNGTQTLSRPDARSPGNVANGTVAAAVAPDPLDGYVEIDLPTERGLRAYWDADILDPEDEPTNKIIEADDPFTVRFRLVLKGRLWDCMAGDWWFDLGFAPLGKGTGFDLSEYIDQSKLWVRGWKGCAGGGRRIELNVVVPANTIPTEKCGTVYECAGKFQMYCCGKPAAVVGFEPLEEFQFYTARIED